MGDFALEREHVFHRTLVGFGPRMAGVAKIDKSQSNAELVSRRRDCPFEQVSHSKLATNCTKIAILARRVGARAPRSDYFHASKLRQIVRDLDLHSFGEIGILASRT